jgi:hypothetical protein
VFVECVFVECVSWMRVFQAHTDRTRERGWPVYERDTGHEAMVTAPTALADILLAQGPPTGSATTAGPYY